jgi:hypothetical protein
MKRLVRLSGGLLASLVLIGCVEDTGPSSATNPMFPKVGFSPEVSNAAVSACSAAVDAQTDGRVQVVGSEFSQAASAVYLLVGDQQAQWRCLSSNEGSVSEVMFVGSEGSA